MKQGKHAERDVPAAQERVRSGPLPAKSPSRPSIFTVSTLFSFSTCLLPFRFQTSYSMPLHDNLDAHEKPPESLRYFFKAHQKSDLTRPEGSVPVIDPGIISTGNYYEHLLCVGNFTSDSLEAAFTEFLGVDPHENPFKESLTDIPIFESKTLPGQHHSDWPSCFYSSLTLSRTTGCPVSVTDEGSAATAGLLVSSRSLQPSP
jgi:hypothetical protein